MATTKTPSIIELLKADHREVEELFAQFENAEGLPAKQARLASRIGQALTVHAEIEEALFYPAVLKQLDDDDVDLVCEATVEHGTLRGLIAGMNGQDVSSRMVKAHVTVLKEYVEHHVREEEREIFPRVEKTGLDLRAMGDDMLDLKRQLTDAAGEPREAGSQIGIVDLSARDLR